MENVAFAIADNFPEVARKLGLTLIPEDVSVFFRKMVEDTISYRRQKRYTRNDFLQLLLELMDDQTVKGEGFKGAAMT